MQADELRNRFEYHPPKDEQTKKAHERIRNLCLTAALEIDLLTPDSREKLLAITKLEEAMMWANAAIARNPVPDQESE